MMGWETSSRTPSVNMLISRTLIALLLFFQLTNYAECLPEDSPETVFCQKFVRSKGYLCEEQKIYTEDGFELLLHKVKINTAQRGRPSDNMAGDAQYNLKVARNYITKRNDKSVGRLTSDVKHADPREIAEGRFPGDVVYEQAQPFEPYDLAKPQSDSRPRPFESYDLARPRSDSRLRHQPRSTDARDLPENVPLSLPPLSVEYPAITIDPQVSSAQPPKTHEPTLLPTSTALNPYSTSDQPGDIPLAAEVPTANPFCSQPSESQRLSPKASTTALPPLWYIPGATQSPVQSEPSDLPDFPIPTDGPFTSSSSPELPPIFSPRNTYSPPPPLLEIPGQLSEPIDRPQPYLGPDVPDPTTISTTAPSLSQLPPESAFPEPLNRAPSGAEIPDQLQGPIDQSQPYLGPVVSGDLPLIASPSSSPIESVDGPAPGIVPAPDHGDERSRPVLLLHHELLNGDMWFTEVNKDRSSLLPFLLADDGFEVWVGHERATYWSHDHTRLKNSEPEYWDWTWDEFVDRDLPLLLTHISANTHSKVHVVGVSQSAAVAVAASTQQAVASLMKSLVLVGPSIYYGSAGQQLQTWGQLIDKFIDTESTDPAVILGPFNISRILGVYNWTLGGPASIITGPDCCISTPLALFNNGWDGTTSYKNIQHVQQGELTNSFQRFDYGSASDNLKAYGQTTPPAYSPANIPTDLPVQVIYAGNDFFNPPQGTHELFLALQMPPVKVYLPLYAHFDLLYSSTRYQDVYFPILSFLRDSSQAT